MGKTAISWTDATWNPVRGCSRVSEGCRHCYAEQQAARIVRMGKGKPTPYDGLVRLAKIPAESSPRTFEAGEPAWIKNQGGDGRASAFGTEARWTGKVVLDAATLAKPLRWRRRRRIFVNSMSDLFHERLTNEQIAAVFGVMAACPQHTFQVLTKRAKRMREWFAWLADRVEADAEEWAGRECGVTIDASRDACVLEYLDETATAALAGHFDACHLGLTTSKKARWPLPNVWLGASVENQDAADERIADLLDTPSAVRFISAEPLLGEVSIPSYLRGSKAHAAIAAYAGLTDEPGIEWVIAGCESGPGARPCSVAWLRSLRDQCAAAGVPFFLKQAAETADGLVTEGPDEPGGYPRVWCGEGSKRKPGGVIELPYLDGKQHAAFPAATTNPTE